MISFFFFFKPNCMPYPTKLQRGIPASRTKVNFNVWSYLFDVYFTSILSTFIVFNTLPIFHFCFCFHLICHDSSSNRHDSSSMFSCSGAYIAPPRNTGTASALDSDLLS